MVDSSILVRKNLGVCDKCKTVDSRLAFNSFAYSFKVVDRPHIAAVALYWVYMARLGGGGDCWPFPTKCVRQSQFQLAARQTRRWPKLSWSGMSVVLL